MRATLDSEERSRRTRGRSRGGRLPLVLLLLPWVAALVGCRAEEAPSRLFNIDVVARDDRGAPLGEIVIATAGAAVGRTDAQGRLRLGVRGREDSLLRLEPRCPDGSTQRETSRELRLPARAEAPLELTVTCERANRVAALLVNAPGLTGLPIVVQDRVVARTDRAGSAHVLLEGAPGTQMRVVLDTSAYPKASPRSPERTVTIGSDDAIEVFATELREGRKKRSRRERRHGRASHERARERDH